MSSHESVLPANWRELGFADHVADPFSDAALAVPVKSHVDVGSIDLAACNVYGFTEGSTIKERGVTEMRSLQYDGMNVANGLFATAAREVLGEDVYARCEVKLSFRRSFVPRHSRQVPFGVHIDYWQGHEDVEHLLVGVAFDDVPPVIVHGALTKDDIDSGGHVMRYMGTGFRRELLEPHKLHLLAAATPHEPTEAWEGVDRTFIRWAAIDRQFKP